MLKVNNKNIEVKENKSNQECRYTNTIWTISILGVLIIGLLAFIFSQRVLNANDIKIFIEYATTLLSITLSIFAIAFTYTSNNSVQRQFDKIDYAARKIVESADSLYKSEEEITNKIRSLQEHIADIKKDMGIIKDNIPNSLSEFKQSVDSTTRTNVINS